MLIFDKLIIGGIKFVLGKVAGAVEAELNDDTSLREQLLAAQMQVELGEMSQEDFAAFEEEILLRLRDIKQRQQGGAAAEPMEFKKIEEEQGGKFTAEISFGGDEEEDDSEK